MLLERAESGHIRPSLSVSPVSRQSRCQALHATNKLLNTGLTSSLPVGILVPHIYLSLTLQSHSLHWKRATEFNVPSPEIWGRFFELYTQKLPHVTAAKIKPSLNCFDVSLLSLGSLICHSSFRMCLAPSSLTSRHSSVFMYTLTYY